MSTGFDLISRLVGDVLVCTAFLSYSGPFNQDFRLLLNQKWFKELKNRKIPCTLNLSIIDMLTDPTVVSYKICLWKYKP
jgi:dynein heavy chain